MEYFLIFLASLVVSLLTVRLVRPLAERYRIGSLPSPRKVHTGFKPLLGGVGFLVGILLATLLARVTGILPATVWHDYAFFWLGLGIIFLTGLLDDLHSLGAVLKFSGQALAAAALIYGGCRIQAFTGPLDQAIDLGYFAIPFTFLWIIFIINAVNLLDGLDGLAGGVSLIITAGFAVIAFTIKIPFLIVLTIGLAGGILGFLRYNFHPAKIFMGDVGSLLLGYLLAFFSIEALKISGSHQVYFLTAMVLLGVPVSDTLIAFLRRLGRGEHPFKADREHVHHRLMKLGLSHPQTVWFIYLFTLLFVLAGLFMFFFPGVIALILYLAAFAFVLYWIWRLGYVEAVFAPGNATSALFGNPLATQRPPLNLNRIRHRLLIVASDLVTLNLALYLTHWVKFRSGLFPVSTPPALLYSGEIFLLFTLAWLVLFWLNNLYQMPWDVSRFDKTMRVTKVITFGIIVLGLFTTDAPFAIRQSHLLSLGTYWLFMVGFVNGGRLLVIEMEKKFRIFEYAPKRTLVIGCNEVSERIIADIRSNPHLIFEIVGLICQDGGRKTFQGLPVLGNYNQLPRLIQEERIEEIIIAVEEGHSHDFIQILNLCATQQVVLKVPPGVHEIFTTQQMKLAGHNFLKVFPESMVLWQWMIKRLFDFATALGVLMVLSPLLAGIALYLRWRFRKSVLVQVPTPGRNGRLFNLLVFRLNEADYHPEQNPIYVGQGMPSQQLRGFLKILYDYRLYKLPQFFNVLFGQMSLIGPRPEPLEWYEQFPEKRGILFLRLTVRPGLTGLAQVKYRYEHSQKIVEERVKSDIYYVENMSLRLDLRILFLTLILILRGPGRRFEVSNDQNR